MSDGLTTVATPEPLESAPEPPGHPAWLVAGLQGLLIVVVFAGVGALCGWLWFHLWDAPKGAVSGGQWYTGEAGLVENASPDSGPGANQFWTFSDGGGR